MNQLQSSLPVRRFRGSRPLLRERSSPGRSAPPLDDEVSALPCDRGFAAMLAGYYPTGGAVRGDDLALELQDRKCGDCASLAKLLVSQRIFGFGWDAAFWVPMFQFDQRDLSLRLGPLRVLSELLGVFDDWTLAAWFVQRNVWLDDRRPVDVLDTHLTWVLAAARTERYIARG
jgi:hypothetical protein